MADPDRSEWPTTGQVARRLGRSVSTVRKMRLDAQLEAKNVEGVWRFDPTVVDRMAEELQVGEGSPAASSAKLAMHAESTMASVVDTLVENNQKLLDFSFRMIDRSHAYIEKLESTNQAQRESAARAEFEEHERELAREKARHDMAMREKALSSLTTVALPIILQRLGHKMPASPAPPAPASNGDGQAAMKIKLADGLLTLLATLDDTTIAKLKDVLPETQFQMISNVYSAVKEGAAA